MTKLLLSVLTIFLVSAKCYSGEIDCLARVGWAESRGEPLEGVIVLMQSSMTRAKNDHISVCNIPANKLDIPKSMKPVFMLLAREVVSGRLPAMNDGSDSWNSGKLPRQPGAVRRIVGNHVFYAKK